MDCGGFMASIAQNVLRAVRHLGHSIGPPGPEGPDDQAKLQQSAVRREPEPGRQCPNPSVC